MPQDDPSKDPPHSTLKELPVASQVLPVHTDESRPVTKSLHEQKPRTQRNQNRRIPPKHSGNVHESTRKCVVISVPEDVRFSFVPRSLPKPVVEVVDGRQTEPLVEQVGDSQEDVDKAPGRGEQDDRGVEAAAS